MRSYHRIRQPRFATLPLETFRAHPGDGIARIAANAAPSTPDLRFGPSPATKPRASSNGDARGGSAAPSPSPPQLTPILASGLASGPQDGGLDDAFVLAAASPWPSP